MSICFHVFLRRDRLPDPRKWANAILENGFSIALNTAFDPVMHSGYLPCPGDEGAGFEYYLDSAASSDLVSDESSKRLVRGCDVVATFCFGGRQSDLAAARAASATLTRITGGILLDAESGHFIDADSVLDWAHESNYQPLGELHMPPPINQTSTPVKPIRKIWIVSIGLFLGLLIAYLLK